MDSSGKFFIVTITICWMIALAFICFTFLKYLFGN